MPLQSRYLRETFKGIRHTGDLAKDLKQLKNGKNAHSGPGSRRIPRSEVILVPIFGFPSQK